MTTSHTAAPRAFVAAYIEALLWAGIDDGGNPLDDNYGPEDIAPESLAQIEDQCADFYNGNRLLLEKTGRPDDMLGHDFLLTRDGHGTGFWDRGLGDIGAALADACRPYGESGYYIGDDGLVHVF